MNWPEYREFVATHPWMARKTPEELRLDFLTSGYRFFDIFFEYKSMDLYNKRTNLLAQSIGRPCCEKKQVETAIERETLLSWLADMARTVTMIDGASGEPCETIVTSAGMPPSRIIDSIESIERLPKAEHVEAYEYIHTLSYLIGLLPGISIDDVIKESVSMLTNEG